MAVDLQMVYYDNQMNDERLNIIHWCNTIVAVPLDYSKLLWNTRREIIDKEGEASMKKV